MQKKRNELKESHIYLKFVLKEVSKTAKEGIKGGFQNS